MRQERLFEKSPKNENGVPLSKDKVFCRNAINEIIKAEHRDDFTIISFYKHVSYAYILWATYLQQKLPLYNTALWVISLDPAIRGGGHIVSCQLMKREDRYDWEVQYFHVDASATTKWNSRLTNGGVVIWEQLWMELSACSTGHRRSHHSTIWEIL